MREPADCLAQAPDHFPLLGLRVFFRTSRDRREGVLRRWIDIKPLPSFLPPAQPRARWRGQLCVRCPPCSPEPLLPVPRLQPSP